MKTPRLLSTGIDAILEFLARIRVLGPVSVAKLKYFQLLRAWPDLRNPKDLNEKINWLKLYGDTSSWSMLADKYAVRDYVRDKGFGDNLVRLLGRWDRAEDIDWESLPDRFVMKTNNRSGDALICKDKSKMDGEAVKAHFSKLLRKKYGIGTSELHYCRIKPCIIAEELLDSSTQKGSSSIIDYKIWCIDGKPKWVMCTSNRTPESLERSIFDTDWNYHPEYIISEQHYVKPASPLARPENLDEMFAMAASLSEGFPVVRIDLYNIDGKVYFGEMTFTPAGGCMKGYTKDFLLEKGAMVRLVPATVPSWKDRRSARIISLLQKHQASKEITRFGDRNALARFYAGAIAYLSSIRLFLRYKYFRPSLPDALPEAGKVILSLTSFPKRMKHLWMVIDLLMRQEERPAEIVLCLFKGDFPDGKIPESLEPYLSLGLRILWADENLKPHLKYYYTFKEEYAGRKRLIVTVDDDIFYPNDTVSRLLAIHKEYPDAVCANIARRIEGEHYLGWAFENNRTAPDPNLLAMGFGGVLYPSSFYGSDIIYDPEHIRSICLKADDLWLKRCENLAGVDVATGAFFAVPPDIPSSQIVSLSTSNVGQGQNDVVWAGLQRLDS